MPYYQGRNEQGDGARRGRLRAHEQPALDARVHGVRRPRLDQHGHRRRAGDDQPPAGAAAARRRVRHARGRHRAAGARGPDAPTTSRSTTASSRSRATGTGSTAPSSSPRRCWRRCACSPTRPRPARSRSRCRRTCRPRRSTGPRSCSSTRVWHVRRPLPEPDVLAQAAALLRGAAQPADRLRRRHDLRRGDRARCARSPRRPASRSPRRRPARARSPTTTRSSVGAIGATGTTAANALAREADVVLGVGTRWSDFTTASRSLFARRDARSSTSTSPPSTRSSTPACRSSPTRAPASRRSAEALEGVARRAPARASSPPSGTRRSSGAYTLGHGPLPAQSEVIGAVNRISEPDATSSSARPARCPATCTSSGARATRRATTSSTATRAWATRSPAASA